METILLRELLEAVHGTLLTQDVPMDTPIYRVETDDPSRGAVHSPGGRAL